MQKGSINFLIQQHLEPFRTCPEHFRTCPPLTVMCCYDYRYWF